MEKINVGILFGGRSAEHEVSLISARSIFAAIDKSKYNVTLIGITRNGQWLLAEDGESALSHATVDEQSLPSVTLNYTSDKALLKNNDTSTNSISTTKLDVIFPVLHGPYGEDGTVQGLLELADIAYVGCGVAASAIAMDKVLAKLMFSAVGLPQTRFTSYRFIQWFENSQTVLANIKNTLTFPLFVKPANMGSSIGISKVHKDSDLSEAINLAFDYDSKIIVEESAEGFKEIECAVLGNNDIKVSVLGEIKPGNEFYDYQTKYFDDNSTLIVPATLSQAAQEKVKNYAIEAFKAIDGSGLGRVDFFVSENNETIYINEINTMPGFTPISMYPKLWQASGLEYPDLIDKLIQLGIEKEQGKNKTC